MKEMRPILEEISRKQTYFLVLVLSLFIFISCSDDSKVQDKKCPTNCETWEACNADFNCELKEGYCIDKDNCNDDEICNSEHKCEKATVNDCLINDDCGLNQICNNEKKCEYKEGYCLSDNDCKNSQVCNSENLCEDKVQVNNCFETNCQEWETCNQETKSCDFISGKCQSDEDCESELKCNNQNYCSFESETPEDNYISTTIQNLQTDTNFIDKKVQTTGIITAIALSQKRKPKGLYIQFGEVKHSGIYVYFIEASDTNLKVGDRVIVKGILDRYQAQARIRTRITDIIISKSGEMPYTPVEVDYFTAIDDYESMLISANIGDIFNLREFLPQHIIFSDGENKKIYIKDTVSYLNHLALKVKLVTLKGILEKFEDEYEGLIARILPRSEDDIFVYMPVCESSCNDWEECLDRDVCVISPGRCAVDSDCASAGLTCDENNYCQAPNLLENSDLDTWVDNKPEGYIFGKALTVVKEENRKESSLFSARIQRTDSKKDNNNDIEFLSPPIFVDSSKNYDFSLFVYDSNYNVDAKIYYKAYNFSDRMIGSGIAGGNDFTQNNDAWVQLKYTTGFVNNGEIWGDIIENLSYIRIGLRVTNENCEEDITCPPNHVGTGNGYIYIDSLSITEK